MEKTELKKVGQTPEDPNSPLLLCGACTQNTVVLYSDFPGLCDGCTKVAHAVTKDQCVETDHLHGFLAASAEDLATLAFLMEEAGLAEPAAKVRQAVDLLWKSHNQALDALADGEE